MPVSTALRTTATRSASTGAGPGSSKSLVTATGAGQPAFSVRPLPLWAVRTVLALTAPTGSADPSSIGGMMPLLDSTCNGERQRQESFKGQGGEYLPPIRQERSGQRHPDQTGAADPGPAWL